TGSIADWDATCTLFGKTKYVGGWQYGGNCYGETNSVVYEDAQDWWTTTANTTFPAATYNDILIMQDSVTPDCWAFYAEDGAMSCFGSPSGAGYAFCRGGATASKRYTIYICQ
ncbi:MAG TPA: hypothetical protein VL172_21810, partial [Kofleriaceae bacterium]|nr:hypothetical protein [Kofleriaceae bacterium]